MFRAEQDTRQGIEVAGAQRDSHELAAHGYVHVVTTDPAGHYTSALSHHGRSRLGRGWKLQ